MNYRTLTCPRCGETLHVGWIGAGCTEANDPGVWCSFCNWSNTLDITKANFRKVFE